MITRFQNDVDDAGDGVGAVLRRVASEQYLDMIDCANGDRVDIHARLALLGPEGIHTRRRMAPLAVDQHQQMVRAESVKRQDVGESCRVGIECLSAYRRRELFQGIAQIDLSGRL